MSKEKVRKEIISIVQKLDTLPRLDTIVLKLQKLMNRNKDEIDIDKVVKIIQRDIGLSSSVLKIANNPYYSGRYGRIGNIRQSIMRLGLSQVSRICLVVKGMKLFPATSNLISTEDFWRHSISVALVIQKIANKLQGIIYDDANSYIAGLFHDIGILVFDRYFFKMYNYMRNYALEHPGPMFEIEQNIAGIDHGEIGGLILKRWNFPDAIIEAITNHHHPFDSPREHQTITQLVHISDFSCSALGSLGPGEPIPQECSMNVWDDLGIDIEQMKQLINETEEEIAKSGTLIDI
jgi:putative nucleotidyltransferase with HDIG domain